MNPESRRKSINDTLFFYVSLILNIFLGWIVARLNTNYLTIAAYGQYAFFITILLLGRSLFDFGVFEASSRLMAIGKSREERARLLGSSLVWAIMFACLSVIALLLLGEVVDNIFEVKVGFLCKKFAFGIGFFVLISHVSRLLRGMGYIKTLAFISIIPRIIYIFLLLLVITYSEFTLPATLEMLFWGLILTLIAVWIYLKPSFEGLKEQTIRIRDEVRSYGFHIYVSTVWGELLIHADKFVISYFLDSQSLAFYALAYTLAIPLSLFSTSLSTSLFNRFASVDIISLKVIRANLLFVLISVIIFILIRKPLIYYLFSAEYGPTIELLLPLALAFGFAGLSKPYIMFLMANKYGKIVRNISVIIPIIQISLSIFIIPIYGISGVAWVTSVVYAIDLALFVLAYQRVTKISFSELL